MNTPCWIITRDHLEECDIEVYGPNGVTKKDTEECTIPFRLYDDDDVLYYEGKMSEDCEGFEPLDHFGMPNAGCTWIETFENGKWSQL